MTNFRKIILISFWIMFSTSAFSLGSAFLDADFMQEQQEKENTVVLSITINSNSTIKMKDVPQTGNFEVMSVLGKRVTIKEIKDCMDGVYLELPNGIYILKAGKIAQKIVVRN